MTDSSAEPAFEVVKGNPTEDELAALLTVLKSRRAGPAAAAPRETENGWSAYWRALRAPLRPGPGGWRASGREA